VIVPAIATSADEVPLALMATLVPTVVTFFVAFFGMQAKPPTPPSASAEDHGYDSFLQGLKMLASTWQYWLIFLAFGIGVGIFNAVATLMSQILVGQGYTENDAGLNSAVLIGAGIFGAAGTGLMLDRTHWFLGIFKTTFVFATASFALFAWCVWTLCHTPPPPTPHLPVNLSASIACWRAHPAVNCNFCRTHTGVCSHLGFPLAGFSSRTNSMPSWASQPSWGSAALRYSPLHSSSALKSRESAT
jgi:hypothetical protein